MDNLKLKHNLKLVLASWVLQGCRLPVWFLNWANAFALLGNTHYANTSTTGPIFYSSWWPSLIKDAWRIKLRVGVVDRCKTYKYLDAYEEEQNSPHSTNPTL